ncbi:MAG: PilN domain-containing protein [candidate division Zixibacteria bacterium]|nr:PilN domain-containing protein [candidate division Zixibacteria bacterium]MDH3939140.1 PilN domain-containing protein [candidate division Zixibacteria bacterium]MDH4034020.1 PilN domain-containing protein [candidate division Zixibacteria bacterium]
MIEINLLPKEYRKRSFDFSLGKAGLYVIGGAVGVVCMLFAITFLQKAQITELDTNIARAKRRAAMLQKDIQLVEGLETVKAKITQRMSAVERLDSHRNVWVQILEEMARDVPEFVWLVKFSQDELPARAADDTTTAAPTVQVVRPARLEGYSFTLNALAAFMINIMRSDYFAEVELVSTNEVKFDKYTAFNFVLSCDVHLLADEESRKSVAQADVAKKKKTTSHKSLN